MSVEFKSMLNLDARQRKALETEAREAEWAQLGRVVDQNMRDTKFTMAIQTAIIRGGTGPQIANRITTYLLTGTIAK